MEHAGVWPATGSIVPGIQAQHPGGRPGHLETNRYEWKKIDLAVRCGMIASFETHQPETCMQHPKVVLIGAGRVVRVEEIRRSGSGRTGGAAMRIRIRAMREDDPLALAEAFADMRKRRDLFDRYWRENAGGARLTLVAKADTRVVGYGNLVWLSDYPPFREERVPEIVDLNVVTPLRGRGVGTKLVSRAERIARERGYKTIGIAAGVAPGYAAARRLYPQLGYSSDETGIHEDACGGGVYMTKELWSAGKGTIHAEARDLS